MELIEMRSRRDNVYAMAVLHSTSRNYSNYQTERNKFINTLRNKKRNYMVDKLNGAKGDVKETMERDAKQKRHRLH